MKEKILDPIPHFPEVSIGRMQADLNNEFMNLESGYNTRKAQRIENWKRYNFEPYGNEKAGNSKMTDSSIFNTVEWMLPSLIQPFIQTSDFIKLIPESASIKDIVSAEYNRELLNYQMRKRMDLYSIYYDTFKTFLIGGSAYLKLTWQKRDRIMGEPVGRPNLTAVSPDSIRYDWTVKGGFMKSRVVTHEEDWTRSDILGMKGQKGVIEDELEKVLTGEGSVMKTSRLNEEQRVDKNFVGETQTEVDPNKKLFLRREQWTTYDMDGSGKLIPVLAVFVNDCLVQVIKNPYDFQRPPFVAAEYVRDPLGNPAAGMATILEQIQSFRTSILRMISDNLNSQQNGLYEVDQTQVDDIGFQLLMNAPSGTRMGIPTRRPGSINPLKSNPLAPQTLTAWEIMELAGENRSGFPRYAQGLNPSSLSQTATGVIETSQRSEMRLWEIATRFGETTLKPLIRMIISLNQQMLEPQDIEVQFGIDARDAVVIDPQTGEEIPLSAEPRDLIQVRKEDIGGYFSVDLDIKVGSDKQNEINNLLQYAQYFGSIEAIPPEVINIIAVETAKLMGIPKVEAFMRRGYVKTESGVSIPSGVSPTTGETQGNVPPVGDTSGVASVPGANLGGLPGFVGPSGVPTA